MKDKLNIKLNLEGEASFFIQLVMEQTGKSFEEVMTDMLSVYKMIYFNKEQELAWIKGDTVIKKLSTQNLWRKK